MLNKNKLLLFFSFIFYACFAEDTIEDDLKMNEGQSQYIEDEEMKALDQLEQEAQNAQNEQKWDEAIQHYTELSKKDPSNSSYLLKLAKLYSYKQEWELSEYFFQLYLNKNNDDVEARTAFAWMYYWKKDYNKANRQITIVLKKSPEDVRANLLKGKLYIINNEKKQAIESFNKILKQDPNNYEAIFALAQLNFIYQHFSKAQDLFLQAKNLNENIDLSAINQLGHLNPYVNPSISETVRYSQEKEKDLILKIYTVQLKVLNSKTNFHYPINDYFQPFLSFEYFSELQENLVATQFNNYNNNNYLYNLGADFYFNDFWTSQINLPIKHSANKKNNIFNLKGKTLFEPSFIIKYNNASNFIYLTGRKDSFVGKNYPDINTYLVQRYQAIFAYEYRFSQPLTGVGAEGSYGYYDGTKQNKKVKAAGWVRVGGNLLTGNLMGEYKYRFETYDRPVADYYSFKKEYTHFIKVLASKNFLPNKYFELTYMHLWKEAKDQTNDAVKLTYSLNMPEVLLKHKYEADVFNARIKLIVNMCFHFDLEGEYYNNTDDYSAYIGKLHAKLVF